MRERKPIRTEAEAIRRAILKTLDHAGANGMGRAFLSVRVPASASLTGVSRNATAAEKDAALDELEAEGLVAREVVPADGRSLGAGVIYRSVAAVEREEWFEAEARRRGLVKPRGVPLLGRVS